MTITYVSGTGVSTATAARGTTSTTVAYSGVAAGRLAIITAQAKLSTATFGAISGWTQLVNVTGGTGTAGADTGTTRLGVWYRELDGTETGNVTVTVSASSGGNVTAVMDVYSKDGASWITPIAVTGSDTTHGTNPSAVCGVWASTLAPGDLLFAGYATDTDNTAAASSHVLTQSGTTIGARTARSRLGNSSGNDGSVFTWDAQVTLNGSTNAPTAGFTWAASSCGPVAVVRLRESAPFTSTIIDDFDDGVIANPPWARNYGTTSETGGRARTVCDTGWGAFETNFKYKFDLLSAQIFPPSHGGATSQCYAGAYADTQTEPNGTDVGWQVDQISGLLRFEMRTGYWDNGAATVVFNQTTHAWVRMRLSGTDLIWETAPDGLTWTQRRTAAAPAWLLSAENIGLVFETHRDGGTNDFYEIDNLNITPSPSTTPVSNTLDVRWASYAEVSAATDLRWKVSSQVASATDIRWAVRSSVENTLDARWAVRDSVAQSTDLRWAVKNGVSSDTDLRWRVANHVNQTSDLRWTVSTSLSSAADLRWRSYVSVASAMDLRWVAEGRVSNSLDARWRVAALVAQDLDARWQVRNAVQASVDARWMSFSGVSAALDVRWLAFQSSASSLELEWQSFQGTGQAVDLRWRSMVRASNALAVDWLVRQEAASALDARWAVRSSVARTLEAPWRVLGLATSSVDLRWEVVSSSIVVGNTVDLRWRTSEIVSSGTDLRWLVGSRASNALEARWLVRQVVAQTAELPWLVREVVAGTLDARWDVYVGLGAECELTWRMSGLVDAALDLRWVSEPSPLSPIPLPADVRYTGGELTAYANLGGLYVVAVISEQ